MVPICIYLFMPFIYCPICENEKGDLFKGPLRRRGCMCWMGPMLPRMGEWAGHLHGHEGSLVGREKYIVLPNLAKSDRHRTMLYCPFDAAIPWSSQRG